MAGGNDRQFGLVNYAQRLHGVQVGLINIIRDGGQFPVSQIVNWSLCGAPTLADLLRRLEALKR